MTQLALPEAVPLAHALVARVARDSDVRVLFIKGPAAVVQGLRSPRMSVDVDALVDPARLRVLREGLALLGWVDENPYSTPTAATYSRTHRHPSWPCEVDLHTTFPGLYAPEQDVFDRLWSRRGSTEIAGRTLPCPDRGAHSLVLALNCLRDPHSLAKVEQLDDLVTRVSGSFGPTDLRDLGELARELGASDTAAPFLDALGAPNPGLGSTPPGDLHAWRLRTQPAWRVATWVEGFGQQPLRSRPRYLWNALFLSEGEFRHANPSLGRDRRSLLRARVRRVRRGVRALPAAVRIVLSNERPASRAMPGAVARTTWRSRRIPGPLIRVAGVVIGSVDRVLPKRGIVLRTFPDFDDQGLETAAALVATSSEPVTWLVKGAAPSSATRARVPAGVRLQDAGGMGGLWCYLRARVVVHTHGVYGGPPRSARKLFVNLWHGWGTKQLVERPLVARRQSDLVTVPSIAHAQAVAAAWGLELAHLPVTGLPRNDAMVRASGRARPTALEALIDPAKPLVVWLPTYRSSVIGEIRQDGRDFDNDFQLPAVGTAAVEQLARNVGVEIVVKTHPMARIHSPGDSGLLHVWDNAVLETLDVTLYELLGHADVLVTDYSSVWVDYLLLDRPIVFTTADLEDYCRTRGAVSAEELAEQLPGPMVEDLEGLRTAVSSALNDDEWAEQRRRLLHLHHEHVDSGSARRVADVIHGALARRRP